MDRRNSPSCDALWTATLLQGDDVSNVGILDDSTNTNFGSLGVSSPLLADDSRLAFLDDKENIQRSSSLQDGQSRSYSQLSGRKRSRGTASDKTMDWSSSRFVAPEKSNLEHSFADMSGVPKAAMGAAPEAALVPKVKSESDEQVGASAEQRDARTIYAPGTVIPGVPLRPEEEEIEREAFWKYGTLPEVDLRGAPTAAAVADAALLAPTSEDCAVPPAAAATAALLPESKSEHDYQEDMVERLEGYITVRIENGRSFDGTVDGTEKMPDGSSSKELLEWLRQYADDTIPKTPAMLRAQPLIEELLHSHSRSFDELASDVDSSKTYQDFVAEFKNIFRREKGYGFSGSESHPLFEKSNRADHRAEDLLEMLSSLVIQQFSDEDRSVIIALLVSTWQDLLTANYRMTPDELEAKQDAFRRDVANQISYHYHVLQIPLERTFIRFANGRGGNKYRAIYVHLQDATSKRYVKMLAPLIGLANAKAFVKKLNETWEGEVMLMVYVGRTKDGQPTVHYNVCASRNKTREGREREGIRVVGFSSKAMVPVRTTLHNYADIQLMENSMQLFVTQGPLRVCLAYVQEKNTPTDLVPAMPPRTMATEPNGDDEDVTIREQAREIVRLKAALQRSENENARLQAALSPSPTTQQQQQQQQQQPAELMATIAEKDRVIAGLGNKLAKLQAIWNECTGRLLSGQQLLSAPLQQSSQPHPAAIASIPAEGAAYGTRTPDRSTNTDAHTSEPRCHERTDVPLHTCATGIRKTRRYRHHPAPSPATLGGQRPSRFFLPDEDEECEGNNTANRRAHQDIEDDIQVSNHHLPLTNEYEAYKNTSESNNEDVMEYEQWVLGLVQDLLDNELKLNHIGNPLELHKVLGGITASMVDQLTKRGQYRVLECLHLAMYHGSPLFNILHDNLPSALRNKFFVLDEDGDEKPGRRRVWWRSYTSYKGGCPDNLKLVGPGDRLKFYLGFGHP